MELKHRISTFPHREAEWYVEDPIFYVTVVQRYSALTLTWEQPFIDIRASIRVDAETAFEWISIYTDAVNKAIRQFEAWQRDEGKTRAETEDKNALRDQSPSVASGS